MELIFQIGLSGRDLFTFNPDLVQEDDDDTEDGVAYERDLTSVREDEVGSCFIYGYKYWSYV